MTTAMIHAMNSGVWVGKVPAPAGTFFLRASEPPIAKRRDRQPITREEHDDAQCGVIERRVHTQSGKGTAIIGSSG